jgi:pimeloyl-ACP methyl ester carboxylesterase
MRRRLGSSLALAAAVGTVLALITSASASAATSTIAFSTCADAPAYGCAHLVVPLDPSGVIPGTVALSIRRKLAATGTASDAVIALAGGPGQAALPFATDAAQIMAGALSTRDLVVFDQRGTGDSGALKCTAFANLNAPLGSIIPDCAQELGATRGLYTTDDSVFDIEQIRQALGYSKLVLYGTSYGTKVALRYAAEYPQNVAGLVLDSTVPPDGPDIFDQSSYAAVPRLLDEICASGACKSVPNPVGDLEKVLAHLGRGSVPASYYNGKGKLQRITITTEDVAQVLFDGDDDPALRADFPAAVAAAANGRYGLLAILVDHAVIGSAAEFNQVNNPLYFAAECEELAFPWNRADSPTARLTEALAAAQAMPAGTFGPFSYRTAVNGSTATACANWPFATAAPEPAITSLPDVPTLIISGADDMRTPTSNADFVKTMIPDATVLVVPEVGHSVLTTEFGTCAQDAVNAFFAGLTIDTSCSTRALPAYLKPAQAPPSSLARVRVPRGTRGSAGRTAAAIELTLQWTARELSESLFETLIGSYNPSFNHGLGGVYGGYAKQSTAKGTQAVTVAFHHFSYISGVIVSGSFVGGVGRLQIAGAKAAAGTIVATKPNDFSGSLGGVHVHFRVAGASTAALTAAPRISAR